MSSDSSSRVGGRRTMRGVMPGYESRRRRFFALRRRTGLERLLAEVRRQGREVLAVDDVVGVEVGGAQEANLAAAGTEGEGQGDQILAIHSAVLVEIADQESGAGDDEAGDLAIDAVGRHREVA